LLQSLTGDLRLDANVQRIDKNANGTFTLVLDSDATLHADGVIVTTPAHITADLLRSLAPRTANILAGIRYVSTGTISLAFPSADIKHPLDGFGVVIPRSEKRPINAVTWSSRKFNYRAPEGHVLMRVFFGGSRNPDAMHLDDRALLDTVRHELRNLMGIEAAPLFHRIFRWHQANPQYDVGHLDQIDAAEAALPSGIYLTGSAYRGIGIPDCVHQSQQTAKRIIHDIKTRILEKNK
jgi:oxygen-dependent protoporphyrinogen oxidase